MIFMVMHALCVCVCMYVCMVWYIFSARSIQYAKVQWMNVETVHSDSDYTLPVLFAGRGQNGQRPYLKA
jgi:hypothetical protein